MASNQLSMLVDEPTLPEADVVWWQGSQTANAALDSLITRASRANNGVQHPSSWVSSANTAFTSPLASLSSSKSDSPSFAFGLGTSSGSSFSFASTPSTSSSEPPPKSRTRPFRPRPSRHTNLSPASPSTSTFLSVSGSGSTSSSTSPSTFSSSNSPDPTTAPAVLLGLIKGIKEQVDENALRNATTTTFTTHNAASPSSSLLAASRVNRSKVRRGVGKAVAPRATSGSRAVLESRDRALNAGSRRASLLSLSSASRGIVESTPETVAKPAVISHRSLPDLNCVDAKQDATRLMDVDSPNNTKSNHTSPSCPPPLSAVLTNSKKIRPDRSLHSMDVDYIEASHDDGFPTDVEMPPPVSVPLKAFQSNGTNHNHNHNNSNRRPSASTSTAPISFLEDPANTTKAEASSTTAQTKQELNTNPALKRTNTEPLSMQPHPPPPPRPSPVPAPNHLPPPAPAPAPQNTQTCPSSQAQRLPALGMRPLRPTRTASHPPGSTSFTFGLSQALPAKQKGFKVPLARAASSAVKLKAAVTVASITDGHRDEGRVAGLAKSVQEKAQPHKLPTPDATPPSGSRVPSSSFTHPNGMNKMDEQKIRPPSPPSPSVPVTGDADSSFDYGDSSWSAEWLEEALGEHG